MTSERISEHRRFRAELIRKWKPWEKSGQKTNEGKAKAANRGFKGGWRKPMREIRSILRSQERAQATGDGLTMASYEGHLTQQS